MILPANFNDNLVYSTETQFALCKPCLTCHGSGNDQDISSSVNPTKAYKDKRCKECDGRGWHQQFVTFDQLVEVLAPVLYERFIEKLPEIIARAQMAVIESVMES